MSILVLKQGILDTIQDEGRFGYQYLGINPNGAMDLIGCRISNMLVNNEPDEAVIELHFPAASFQFNIDCVIALSGADYQPVINDVRVEINRPVLVSAGSVLKFTHCNNGSRCYLAIHGGFDIQLWLGSYSTNTKAAAGGYKGRQLLKGDVIELKNHSAELTNTFAELATSFEVKTSTHMFYNSGNIIRCTKGIEFDYLDDRSKDILGKGLYTILPQSDRMGYRLEGESLVLEGGEMLSSGVVRGTVQLLPSGQMIILMADHQTTGGYPKVAQVVTADFPSLAQMRANDKIRFTLVSQEEAEEAMIAQQKQLAELHVMIASHFNN